MNGHVSVKENGDALSAPITVTPVHHAASSLNIGVTTHHIQNKHEILIWQDFRYNVKFLEK